MDQWWGKKCPGNDFAVGDREIILGINQPDSIGLPHELGGTRHRVSSSFLGDCPQCGSPGAVHFVLVGTNLQVAECIEEMQYVWYTKN